MSLKLIALLAATILTGCGCGSDPDRLRSLEKRVDDLEISRLASQPFLRDVNRQEMSAILEFSLAVSKVQGSGFQFSHAIAGTHGTSFVFRRGIESLTKIVLIHEP